MSSSIIKPGPSLFQAARELQTTRKGLGTYPYQWMFPGPNAKQINQWGAVPVAGPGTNGDICSYRVSEGMRFSMRGIAFGVTGAGFNEGIGDSLFNLVVRTSGGNRVVDFFNDISTHMGTLDAPWPILGPLEFDALDTVAITFSDVNTPASDTDAFYGVIFGFEYPMTEAIF